MKTQTIFLLVVIAIALAGCSADKTSPAGPQILTDFRSLEAKDDVLHNLEQAYNKRNLEQYERLFDKSGVFRFYFSPNDVKDGLVKSSEWDLDAELRATGAMFDGADAINLHVFYIEDETEWQAFVPSTHPGETWYDRAFEYILEVRVGDTTYSQRATVVGLLTIRQVRVNGRDIWQIVAWRDDIAN